MARIKSGDRKRAAALPAAPHSPAAAVPTAEAPSKASWAGRGSVAAPQRPAPPSPRVGHLITSAVMLHAALLVLSYMAVVKPSSIQQRALAAFMPYLASFHFAAEASAAEIGTAEGVSFFLVRGDASERVHRLQFKTTNDRSDLGWVDADVPGAAGSSRRRRHQRFLTAVASLAASDQNALVARLILPLLQTVPDAQMVRVIRLPNVMTALADEAQATPYTAAILRERDAIRLVRLPPARLGAAATGQSAAATGDGAAATAEGEGQP